MARWLALAAGAVLVAVAFFAGGHVADTRQGLIFEVVTLLGGLAGVSLLLYGLLATATGPRITGSGHPPVRSVPTSDVRSANELLIGGGGLLVAALLVTGIALTSGVMWALLGFILLLPMVTGCAYMCFRFLRAPKREWKVDLRRLTRKG